MVTVFLMNSDKMTEEMTQYSHDNKKEPLLWFEADGFISMARDPDYDRRVFNKTTHIFHSKVKKQYKKHYNIVMLKRKIYYMVVK